MPKRKTRRKRKGGNDDAAKKIQKIVRGRQSRKKTIQRLSQNPFARGATGRDGVSMNDRRGSVIEREFNISPHSKTSLAQDVKESSEKRVRDSDAVARQEVINNLENRPFSREYLEKMTNPARLLRMNSDEDWLSESEVERRRRIKGNRGGRRRRKTRRKKSRRKKSRKRKTRRKKR